MSSMYERSIRVIAFSGKKKDYRMWRKQFASVAGRRDYEEILDGSIVVPADSENLKSDNDAHKEKILARKANKNAYNDLVLANQDPVAFNLVDKSVTTDLPNGCARTAWLALERKYDSSKAATVVRLAKLYNDSELKNTVVDPEEWIVYLEILRARLEQKQYIISEKNFQMHVLNRLPSQYDNTVEDLENKMDDLVDPLDIETMKEKLHARWEKIRNRTKNPIGYELGDVDEQAALFASGNGDFGGHSALLARQFKGRCRNCGKFGHKAADCPDRENDTKVFGDYGTGFEGICHNCGKKGHKKQFCKEKKRNNNNGNKNQQANLSLNLISLESFIIV